MDRALFLGRIAVLVLVIGACNGVDEQGAGGAGAVSATASAESTGASSGCADETDCDDGHSCTIDVCTNGGCFHTIGANSGVTACPSGSYCDIEDGCITSPACGSNDDCEAVWGGDACKANITCDLVSAVCSFDVLDEDDDGHPPLVCGGDDCDDSNGARFPGNAEECDGIDNDCEGTTDDGATCADPLTACTNGFCACKNENTCGAACVDKQSDPSNCGDCDLVCPQGASCESGACSCSPGLVPCDGVCVDTEADESNCGNCGTVCPQGALCQGATCACPGSSLPCDGVCVDTSADAANCGGCGLVCPPNATCMGGSCVCSGGLTACGTQCVDLLSSKANCGACGFDCGIGTCSAGACQCLGQALPCNGTCVNPYADSTNCGGCGIDCQEGGCNVGICAPAPETLVTGEGPVSDIAVDQTHVYWLTGMTLRRAPIAGGAATTIATGQGSVRFLVLDGSTAYFTADDGLFSVPTSGGNPLMLAPGSSAEIVQSATNIYWASAGVGIQSKPKLGGVPVVLASNVDGYGLTSDGSFLYWADVVAMPVMPISRMPLSGGQSAQVGFTYFFGGLQSDAVDLYVADPGTSSVYKQPSGGGFTTAVWKSGAPASIALDGTFVYLINSSGQSIVRAAKDGSSVFSSFALAANQTNPWRLAVAGSWVYWASSSDGTIKRTLK